MKTVFHGSLTFPLKDNKLRALSHFGDRDAALVIIGAHLYLDSYKGTPTMYEWDMPAGSSVIVRDIGSPNEQAILRAFIERPDADAASLHCKDNFWRIKDGKHLEKLQELCGNLDIKVLEYPNAVEGGISYCSIGEVTPTKSYPVPKDEVIKAFLAIPADTWGYSPGEVAAARAAAQDDL
uniref:hypothetical protein n=1 Tax=Burkholderia anthina TaxID=179879 RepID=UPI00158DEF63|nr:hypothetical protein [Burkholderia anthina]